MVLVRVILAGADRAELLLNRVEEFPCASCKVLARELIRELIREVIRELIRELIRSTVTVTRVYPSDLGLRKYARLSAPHDFKDAQKMERVRLSVSLRCQASPKYA
jgi:hypothetical protein